MTNLVGVAGKGWVKEREMERLTERFSNEQAAVYGCGNNCKWDYKYCTDARENCPTINEIYEKLATYEDMEEQGRLVKLPCKAGDTLYRIDVDPNITEHDIIPYHVENIVLCDDGDILFKYDAYDGIICGLKSLTEGEPYLDYYKVFLTREQAEQAEQALQALKREQP